MPSSDAQSSIVSWMAGASRKAWHLRASLGEAGNGTDKAARGAARSSASSRSISLASRPPSSYSAGMSQAAISNCRSRGDIEITTLSLPKLAAASASSMTLRVLTAPTIWTECGTLAGVQMARSGGAIQAP